LPFPCLLNTVILLWTLYYTKTPKVVPGGMAKEGKFTHKGQQAVLFSSDLKDEPAMGSKYCQNKKYKVL
jgi:hypothetical protein